MNSDFEKYLERKGVQLTPNQTEICELLIDRVDNDEKILKFFTLPQTGKTFVFELLGEYFKHQSLQ
jgi:hypothetical protein